MNILINILVALFCLIIGYVFGAFPTGIVIGKVFFHRDPRLEGSHNSGGTNVGRLFGKRIGFLVIIIDMLKVISPMWICWALLSFVKVNGTPLMPMANEFNEFGINTNYVVGWPCYWLSVIGCSVGHCWPMFADFKGGKSVSVFMGTICGACWLVGFLPACLYFLFLKITKMVSLTSIITSITSTLLAWVWAILCMTKVIPLENQLFSCYGNTLLPSWVYALTLTIVTIILVARHHENIHRIKAGNERKISWMK